MWRSPLQILHICRRQFSSKAGRLHPEARSAYPVFVPITTRWRDNDVYGHVNNVVYNEWVDTAVNHILIQHGVLHLDTSHVIGFVVTNSCHFFSPLKYPCNVAAGVKVLHIGRSSVQFEVGIFHANENITAARGSLTHAYVDRRDGNKPVKALPPELLACVQALVVQPSST